MKLFTRFACCCALAVLFLGCGDDPSPSAERCGDGVCSARENELNCPRDCPLVCAPDTVRCLANNRMICRPDGRGEITEPCATGEYCSNGECLPAPDTPDGGSDLGSDMGTDLSDDASADAGDGPIDDVSNDLSDDGPAVELDSSDSNLDSSDIVESEPDL